MPQSHVPDLMVTTLLVTNIHCPSCISYANDVLSTFSESIRGVDVSIIDHTVRVQHIGDISKQIAHELVQASFEVEHVTLTDSSGKIVRQFESQHANTSLPSGFFGTLFMSKAQKQHIENCNACQEQRRATNKGRTTWADVLRWRRTRRRSSSTDVESGTSPSGKTSFDIKDDTITDAKDVQLDGDDVHVYAALLSIEGMTCASCVAAITNELNQQDYIRSVEVNLIANNAKVVFQGKCEKAEDIKEAIEDIGYGAVVDSVERLEQDRKEKDLYQAVLSIEGMTCGSCVGTVTRGVQQLDFVQSVEVDLVNNSARVVFQGQNGAERIAESISDMGYDASIVSSHKITSNSHTPEIEERSVQVEVVGMYCPNCPSNIVAAVKKAFPESVKVAKEPSLKAPYMTLVYRPSIPKVTIRRVIDVVNAVDSACSAKVYHPPSLEERSQSIRRKERNRILRHLLVAFLIAIPSFIIGVVYMDLVPAKNSTRQWFEEPIWAGNAMRIDWALFIITTPAMFYAASIFHTRALKEIWSLWRPRSKVPLLRRLYRFGSMNLLISAGTSVAYFASLAVLIMDATTPREAHGMSRSSTTYFDTVTFLTFFILIGRFLEAYSKAKTGDAVSMLAKLRPVTALLVEDSFDDAEKDSKTTTRQVSVDLLESGDIVSVPHGACPPTDGAVAQEGNFLFDESSLTGESRPAKKTYGEKLYTGTVNVGDPVRMKVTEVCGKSMLDQIVNVVREGQAKRAPIESLADTLTGYFTPVITLLAITTWIIWLALGESGALPRGWLDVSRGGWPYWSAEFAIAVFVVACPCGIGLAAPTAMFVGGGLAAKNGILVRGGGEAFQKATKISGIVFDKTGTLTEGRMRVTDAIHLDQSESVNVQVRYAMVTALEEASTHPIAKAIVQYCDQKVDANFPVHLKTLSIKEIPGQGMSGRFEIKTDSGIHVYEVVIGNERLLDNSMISDGSGDVEAERDAKMSRSAAENVFLSSTLSRFRSLGNSTAVLAVRVEKLPGSAPAPYTPTLVFAITDPVRVEALEVIRSLQSQVDVYMCTGDNWQTAQSIAAQLSIPSTHVRAGALPQDKASFIETLKSSTNTSVFGQHKVETPRTIAFVGDGTNDTPALTVADVSIAISHPDGSGGSDIALTSSSFVLLNSDLSSIPTLIKLSRRVFLRVKLNFVWAAIYNICLIPVAAGVFFPVGASWSSTSAHGGFRLSPVWASVAMAGSSVSVVLSSLALKLPELSLDSLRVWRRGDRTATK